VGVKMKMMQKGIMEACRTQKTLTRIDLAPLTLPLQEEEAQKASYAAAGLDIRRDLGWVRGFGGEAVAGLPEDPADDLFCFEQWKMEDGSVRRRGMQRTESG
jgi:hypothetical protein